MPVNKRQRRKPPKIMRRVQCATCGRQEFPFYKVENAAACSLRCFEELKEKVMIEKKNAGAAGDEKPGKVKKVKKVKKAKPEEKTGKVAKGKPEEPKAEKTGKKKKKAKAEKGTRVMSFGGYSEKSTRAQVWEALYRAKDTGLALKDIFTGLGGKGKIEFVDHNRVIQFIRSHGADRGWKLKRNQETGKYRLVITTYKGPFPKKAA